MRTAIYVRVSTDEQHTENQIPVLEKWIADRNWNLVERYVENESAWKQGHQKELSRLLNDLRSGRVKYDVVLVWALDRLTREGIGTLLSLYDTFNRLGAKLISVQESWTEFPNEFTPMFLAMMGFLANYESKRKSERVKLALARVRANGSKSGKGIGQRGKDQKKRRRTGYLNRYMKE